MKRKRDGNRQKGREKKDRREGECGKGRDRRRWRENERVEMDRYVVLKRKRGNTGEGSL